MVTTGAFVVVVTVVVVVSGVGEELEKEGAVEGISVAPSVDG